MEQVKAKKREREREEGKGIIQIIPFHFSCCWLGLEEKGLKKMDLLVGFVLAKLGEEERPE